MRHPVRHGIRLSFSSDNPAFKKVYYVIWVLLCKILFCGKLVIEKIMIGNILKGLILNIQDESFLFLNDSNLGIRQKYYSQSKCMADEKLSPWTKLKSFNQVF